MLFFLKSSQLGLFPTCRTSQFRQATLQARSSRMGLARGCCVDSAALEWKQANFFSKGPSSQDFSFCGPDSLFYNCLLLLLGHESSHRQWMSGVWPCSTKTLFAKANDGLALACRQLCADPCSRTLGLHTVCAVQIYNFSWVLCEDEMHGWSGWGRRGLRSTFFFF